jgi:hypothetical protein
MGRMTDDREDRRAIQACRRAGLPVVDEEDCTCALRGRLVVLASPDGLRVIWPYDGRCPVHGARDRQGPRRAGRPRRGRSGSQAARPAWAERQAGIR